MAKHKYIETPEKMWELYSEYKDWIKSNPIKVHDFVGKDADEVYRKRERPLTFEGFYNFCYDKIGCIDQYFENRDSRYNEYVAICSRIKKDIRQEQIEGGMCGIYNPSITQRLNSLAEKTESEVVVTEKVTIKLPDGSELEI